ncbi:MAG: hypothetical protein LBH96_04620 [Candidatus Peribacteria bacterium]|jgi:hypothetical protein|nr:hypothetical protein [Candidatus Peribacteria bacterium]
MDKKIIIIEGAILFPIRELHKIAKKQGYSVKLTTNFLHIKKQGILQTFYKNTKAVFIGPHPHSVKGGSVPYLRNLHGKEIGGIKIFICRSLNMNQTIKISKSSFLRSFQEFLNSES